MKSLFHILPFLLLGEQLYAQGTVNFANNSATAVTNVLTQARVMNGTTFKVALYYAPDGTTDDAAFVQLGASVGFLAPGIFQGGTRTTPSTTPPGEFALFQVRAFETAYGTSYEQVIAAPPRLGRVGLTGKSNLVRVRTGNLTIVPATPPGSLAASGLQPFLVGVPPAIVTQVRVSDASIVEGNAGTSAAAFTVSLSHGNSQPSRVTYATADQTAVAGQDYTSANGTLEFAPGEASKTIMVNITGDTTVEADETFLVTLSNPLNAVLARGNAVGTIFNDDLPPAGGTVVFANSSATAVTNSLTQMRVITGPAFKAALYYAPDGVTDETAFVPLGASVEFGPAPGLYFGGTRTTPASTAGGEFALFQVRAFETAYGNTYEEALAAPLQGGRRALTGKSNRVRVKTGGPALVPPTPPGALISFGLQSFTLTVTRPQPSSTYDLSRDFSVTSNPNSPWSYGWVPNIDGAFTLLQVRRDSPADNGVLIPSWQLTFDTAPAVYWNNTTETALSNGGEGVHPPGTVWFFAGEDGLPEKFGAIRFTVPSGQGGTYRVEAVVQSYLDGPLSGDTDFHVARNGVELFGRFLPPRSGTEYSRLLTLASGDTIDFLVGRGADGLSYASGLEIKAALTLVTNSPMPACAAQPPGLVAWWPFDGTGQELTGRSPVNFFGSPSFSTGQVGQALRFDGMDDFGRAEASPALDVGVGPGLTVEGWINPADLNHLRPIAEWNDGFGNIGAHFWISVDTVTAGDGVGDLYANLLDTFGVFHQVRSPANLVVPGVWQHVALTYDKASGQAMVYHNGAIVGQANLGVFTPQTSQPLYFGLRPSGNFAGIFFAGHQDEISVYNRALAATEIQSIANAGAAGKCRDTLPPVNHPPIARATVEPLAVLFPDMTNLLVISPNNSTAVVTLDGSHSTDVDSPVLTFLWFDSTNKVPFATGPVVKATLEVGPHSIILAVSDGTDFGLSTVTFEILTASDAVAELMVLVTQTQLPRKEVKPLLNKLREAARAFDKDHFKQGLHKLREFQKRVRHEIKHFDSATATLIDQAAQSILDAFANQ